MALLTRELELIIIARDHTQSTTARVAGALTLIGGGITAMGIEWTRTLGEMTDEAIDFRNTAALAFTQMFDQAGASIEGIEEAMLRVGRQVPVELGELGEAIFDIFSSIDANIPEAERLLLKVGEAAVAGQTDVRSALIPTIAMMNAFGLSIEDVDYILDQQFITVQRGIITYDEFVSNIGKAIPASVAAGQSIETLGATIAFLTRNGLSAAQASTSAARAFELFSSPKAIAGLEELGIAVRDSRGEFRQIGDVLRDLDTVFGQMTGPERKVAFKEIFGTGRIQARRFFDIAIPNWREFNSLVDVFTSGESVGAMKRAYDVMIEQPRQQLDLLRNRWEALRVEVGQKFIPQVLEKVVPLVDRLFDLWENLDDTQKENLARWAAIGGVVTTVVGGFITLLGFGKLLSAVFGGGGFFGTVAAIGTPLLKFAGAAGLAASAAILIFRNWDKIVDFFNSELRPAIQGVIDFLKPFAEDIVETAIKSWDKFVKFLRGVWDQIREVFENVIGPEFLERFGNLPDEMRDIWERVKEVVGPAVEFIKTVITVGFEFVQTQIQRFVDAFVWIWNNWGDEIMAVVRFVWVTVKTTIETTLTIIRGIFETVTAILKGDWGAAWEAIKETFIRIWGIIMENTENVRATITEWIQGVTDRIKEIWNTGWTAVKDFFIGIWEAILEFFVATGEFFSELWNTTWTAIKDFFVGIWTAIKEFFIGIWNNEIVVFIRDVLGIIYELYRIGMELIQGIIKTVMEFIWNNIIKPIWEAVVSFLSETWNTIKSVATTVWNAVTGLISTSVNTTNSVIRSVWSAVKGFISSTWNTIKSVTSAVWAAVKAVIVTVVRAVWDRVVYYIGLISNVVNVVWGAIKRVTRTAWDLIKRYIWEPIRDAYNSVRTWIDNIIGYIKRLWEKATYWVRKIRDVLSKINPAEWFSPPLTQTVARGFDQLASIVGGTLSNIHQDALDRVTRIRRTVSELEELRHRQQMLARATSTSTSSTTNNINIETTSSIDHVIDELNWNLHIV